MKNLAIRKAIEIDSEAIYQLDCDEMGYSCDLGKTTKRLYTLINTPGHHILVATVDTQVVGYIHANNYDLIYSDPLKNIMGLAVNKSFKRMGIGRKLLYAVEHWAKEDGAVGVRLVSSRIRVEAHQFYLSCGYTLKKEQLNFSKIFTIDK